MPQPLNQSKNPYRANNPLPSSEKDADKDPGGMIDIPLGVLMIPIFILTVFGITFIILGSIFAGKCQLEPMVPIWLIIMGATLLIMGFSVGGQAWKIKRASPFESGIDQVSFISRVIGGIMLLFFLAWFIAGNVWVYTAWGVIPDYSHFWFENGCNKSVYLLSFWGVIFMDAFVGLALIGGIISGIASFVKR